MIPNDGSNTLDNDEISALSLPPKYATLPCIKEEDIDFDILLFQTKQRYSRRTEGSLKEQEEEVPPKYSQTLR